MKNKKPSDRDLPVPSKARIRQRDWMHVSTQDINREIVRLRHIESDADEQVVRYDGLLKESRKVAADAKNDANALEALIESRK